MEERYQLQYLTSVANVRRRHPQNSGGSLIQLLGLALVAMVFGLCFYVADIPIARALDPDTSAVAKVVGNVFHTLYGALLR